MYRDGAVARRAQLYIALRARHPEAHDKNADGLLCTLFLKGAIRTGMLFSIRRSLNLICSKEHAPGHGIRSQTSGGKTRFL
jgi:hypothetical protein